MYGQNSREFKHEEEVTWCYCCHTVTTKDKINIYKIQGRGYGSKFELIDAKIKLCNKCKALVKPEWFNEKPKIIDKYCEDYKHEDALSNFIYQFDLDKYIYYNGKNGLFFLIDNNYMEEDGDRSV